MKIDEITDEQLRLALQFLQANPPQENTIYRILQKEPLAYKSCDYRRRLGKHIIEIGDDKSRVPVEKLDQGPQEPFYFGRDLNPLWESAQNVLTEELKRREDEKQRLAKEEARLQTTRRVLVTLQGVKEVYGSRQVIVVVPPGVDEFELNNSVLSSLADEEGIELEFDDDEDIEATDHDIECDVEDGQYTDVPVVGYPSVEESES